MLPESFPVVQLSQCHIELHCETRLIFVLYNRIKMCHLHTKKFSNFSLEETPPHIQSLRAFDTWDILFTRARDGNPKYWTSVGLFILCYFFGTNVSIVHKVVLSNISSRHCLWMRPLTVVMNCELLLLFPSDVTTFQNVVDNISVQSIYAVSAEFYVGKMTRKLKNFSFWKKVVLMVFLQHSGIYDSAWWWQYILLLCFLLFYFQTPNPLSSNRQHLSYDVCLVVRLSELFCVGLCTEAVLSHKHS